MNHTELAERLQELHKAAQEQRWSDVESGMKLLDEAKSAAFARMIQQMAQDLHAELRSLQLDSRLAKAAAEIPDACTRLDAVIKMTEDAATETLDLVEGSREHVLALQHLSENKDSAEWQQVSDLAVLLRQNMNDLSAAQAYQDLSGQIIRRVMGLVGNLEQTLNDLLKLAGIEPIELEEPEAGELLGPAAGRTDHSLAASQEDADDLLSNLGL